MPPKRPRRKASLHSTGKVREADLLERARALADDPALAMPICEGSCVLFSPAAAARRAIPRIQAARDDEAKLNRYASRGNELAKAYAATLLVARAEKIPYVAELRLPTGSIPYVIRGKAKPFQLAGLQNHHDRAQRLVAFFPWARKRKMHFFSADRGVVCTGRSPTPPRDFVEEEMDELGVEPREGGTLYVCPHGGAGPGRDAVFLRWRAAGVEVERCVECAGKDSTIMTLLKHMAGPRLLATFDVEARLAPLASATGEAVPVVPTLPPDLKLAYLKGAIPDAGLLEGARAARVASLRAAGKRVYIAGGRSFGDDAQAFLEALSPSPAEERALRAGLERNESALVLDKPTVARALAELWPAHGPAMLEAAAGGDAEAARRLHKEKVAPDEAAELVRRAGREGNAKAALSGLPRYARLPPAAAAADAIARAHRSGGPEAGLKAAQERANLAKAKGVVLAFLQAMGSGKGQEWRFSTSDQEVAASLGLVVRRLLEETGEGYHQALLEASVLAGEAGGFEAEP